uniref:Molybdopterin biosynthesis protein n=1 Tax=Cliftonaea pectinata TaxID=2007206 RepID=A0A1Z1MQJ4_9FLOR|nr:Molybdopterin biosynthesis protein [Cliftonaea pectinata]ARW68014.1 Molybdopterin biosynthesis protein [Cliftonaea pectinata]
MLNPNINIIKLNEKEYKQYAKHLILDKIGISGQKRLKKAKILIIGAGGLGCPTILYLAIAGVSYIGIIEYDKIELTNLNRQILYNEKDIGKSKILSAKKNVQNFNSHCKIITHSYYLNETNGKEIISYYDLIIDTSDNFNTRYNIDKICYLLHKTYIYAAVKEFDGQIAVFNYKSGLRYNNIYEHIHNLDSYNCNNDGVIGITTGQIGILQATEAIKIILGINKINDNCLTIINILQIATNQRKIFPNKLKRNTQMVKEKLFYSKNFISLKNLNKLNQDKINNLIILDIRKKQEFLKKHIKNSINIPLVNFKSYRTINYIMNNYYKKLIFIYCNSKNRSLIVSHILNKYELKNYIIVKKNNV